MTNEERDIQPILRVLQHAEKTGYDHKAYRHFGIGRSSFYTWRDAYQKDGVADLKNTISIPKNPPNQTSNESVEKAPYMRRKYHLGPIRIACYSARDYGIKILDYGVYRALRRNRLGGQCVSNRQMTYLGQATISRPGTRTVSLSRLRWMGA